jgi:hypothetical protein
MHDLVKIVRIGLKKAGVRVHKCRNPHHLYVDWRGILKKNAQPSDAKAIHNKQKHVAADGGSRFIFEGKRSGVPMLDVLMNPAKCKPEYLCKQKVIEITS